MTHEKTIAKVMYHHLGILEATRRAKEEYDRVMKLDSFVDIKRQFFWREVLVELLDYSAKGQRKN
jgi:hypothetical protein